MEVIINISIVNDQLEPIAVRDIVDIDIIQCNLVNSMEKCFYNNVFGHLGDGHRHPHQPQIGKLTNKKGATPPVALTVKHLDPSEQQGGASHNDFQQHFSKAINTNRSLTFTSTSTSTSTSKRRTSTSSAANSSTTVSEWKSQSTTETTWRTTSSTTWPIKRTTFLLEINLGLYNSDHRQRNLQDQQESVVQQ